MLNLPVEVHVLFICMFVHVMSSLLKNIYVEYLGNNDKDIKIKCI